MEHKAVVFVALLLVTTITAQDTTTTAPDDGMSSVPPGTDSMNSDAPATDSMTSVIMTVIAGEDAASTPPPATPAKTTPPPPPPSTPTPTTIPTITTTPMPTTTTSKTTTTTTSKTTTTTTPKTTTTSRPVTATTPMQPQAADCTSLPADIVFLLDASTSEGRDNFKKQLDFVKAIVGNLNVSADGVRVGLVTFSTDAHLQFHLHDHMDKTVLELALGFVPYQDGTSHAELGLKYIRENSFTAANGDRPGVQNIVVTMTNGQLTEPGLAYKEARLLRQNSTILISVGIGDSVDQQELTNIASGGNYTLKVDGFDMLGESEDGAFLVTCDAINGVNPGFDAYVPCEKRAVDLAILLDTSGSEGLTHFREQADFAADFVSQLTIGPVEYQAGFLVFAVGIGGNLDMEEVSAIATNPSMAFQVQTFDDLQNFLPTLQTAVCTEIDQIPPYPPTVDPVLAACGGQPADVVFVLDSSSSEGSSNFRKQVYFAGNVTEKLNVGPDKVQISVLTFSTNPRNHFYLNQYSNKYDVLDAIAQTPYYSGATYTDRAIQYVRTTTLSTTHGRRLQAQPIVIILTDGQSSYPSQTLEEAQRLKDTRAVVIAIGIGSNTVESELLGIASDPSHKFSVNTFDLLSSIQQQIVRETCEGAGPTPPPHPACTSTEAADILLIIDTSSAESATLFQKEIDFVKNLINGFVIGPNNMQFSLMTFADAANLEFWFNTHKTKQALLGALPNIIYSQGATNTHEALKFARDYVYLKNHGSRPDANQYVIVITDGRAADFNETIKEANLLKQGSPQKTIMAVGIRQNADKAELEAIATDPSHVFIADDTDALKTLHKDITVRACKSIFELKTTVGPPAA